MLYQTIRCRQQPSDPWRGQNISNTELRETVKRELMTNTCYYVEFVAATSKLHVEIDNLLEHGIYNSDSVDLVIPALCRHFEAQSAEQPTPPARTATRLTKREKNVTEEQQS